MSLLQSVCPANRARATPADCQILGHVLSIPGDAQVIGADDQGVALPALPAIRVTGT